jgi:predicted alpha/beta-fold hydrolase
MAGEMGDSKPNFLDSVVSVSAPIDLAASSKRISQRRNLVFDRYFTRRLVKHVKTLNEKFPDKIPPLPLGWHSGQMSLARFDDMYVAPVSGFKNGLDYYIKCSSAAVIGNIRCRTLLLTASDDPIVDPLTYTGLKYDPLHEVIVTAHGGHAAWIGQQKDPEFDRFWMDRRVVDWVLSLG